MPRRQQQDAGARDLVEREPVRHREHGADEVVARPPAPTTSTRDRIIDVAMELFARNGYKGTSVTQIERAVGLTPGAGGI
ncbi:TetR/AcrR family transcriptional regulator [Actinomadura physcomitrii]